MNYNTLSATPSPQALAVSAGIGMGVMLFYSALIVVMLISCWKIYTKAGQEGWKAIIPVYNLVVLLEIIGKPLWWLVLLFVPFVNIVVYIMVTNELSKVFNKGVGTTIGLLFLPIVFFPILGFGDAKYSKPAMPAT